MELCPGPLFLVKLYKNFGPKIIQFLHILKGNNYVATLVTFGSVCS